MYIQPSAEYSIWFTISIWLIKHLLWGIFTSCFHSAPPPPLPLLHQTKARKCRTSQRAHIHPLTWKPIVARRREAVMMRRDDAMYSVSFARIHVLTFIWLLVLEYVNVLWYLYTGVCRVHLITLDSCVCCGCSVFYSIANAIISMGMCVLCTWKYAWE